MLKYSSRSNSFVYSYSNHHLTSHTCLHKPLLKTLEILVGSPGSYFLTAEGEAEEAEEAGLLYLCL